MASLIEIDGSMGEGGGQILRTAVAVASVLTKPVRIYNIRAKRKNPGLRPQHLTAVKVLTAITGAQVRGLSVGSTEVEFYPRHIRGGRYEFNIGTAGSISLLLQAVLPVLAFASQPTVLRVVGGTDVKMAPTIDYMRFIFLRLLERMGYRVEISVLRRGHYPRGGGIVEVYIIAPPRKLKSTTLIDRGRLLGVRGLSHAVRLPNHVAERQARSAANLIRERLGVEPTIQLEYYEQGRDPHLGPGSGIALWAEFEETVIGADALGEKGKPAEKVGWEAASKLVEDYYSGAAVDRHASDMLPVYMALASGTSEYTGARLTMHTKTVFELLRIMVEGVEISLWDRGLDKPFRARIRGIGLERQ